VEGAIWITRPEPGNRRTARAVEAAGGRVVALPVLEVELVPPHPLPRHWPDWILLVSRNAGLGLEAALDASGMPGGDRRGVRVGAVGQATADWAHERGWNVEVVPERQNAEGLLAELEKRDLAASRVWIPAGDREGTARRLLPPALAERGAEVEVFQVYGVRVRGGAPGLWEPLVDHHPGAIVFHSPSAVETVAEESAPPVVRWRETAAWVAIGDSTAARCEKREARAVVRSAEPSDEGVIAALASIGALGVQGRKP
jgi:uroporphyrinogen-III synthase